MKNPPADNWQIAILLSQQKGLINLFSILLTCLFWFSLLLGLLVWKLFAAFSLPHQQELLLGAKGLTTLGLSPLLLVILSWRIARILVIKYLTMFTKKNIQAIE